jgi:hypothetical protein
MIHQSEPNSSMEEPRWCAQKTPFLGFARRFIIIERYHSPRQARDNQRKEKRLKNKEGDLNKESVVCPHASVLRCYLNAFDSVHNAQFYKDHAAPAPMVPDHCVLEWGCAKRKSSAPLYTQNDLFTKTGSGQT